ncbi:hypothetical protein F5887DRAFT_919429 [Amanita rubescens]|nr:hypothetical protein F5887DRAFT_919429 [Amanita rubescens]
MPVSSLRAIPSNRLMNEPKLSLSNVSKRRTPNVVSTKQVVSRKAHLRSDARSGASLPTANRPFGKTPSGLSTGGPEQLNRAMETLGSPCRLPENIPERSEEHSIQSGRLANEPVISPLSFDETGEKRRTLDHRSALVALSLLEKSHINRFSLLDF